MSQQLFRTASDDQRTQSSADVLAAAEPPSTVFHGIQIRRVMRPVGQFNKVSNMHLIFGS